MADYPLISGYRIISMLGEGGVAKVYLGIQEKLKRRVAIKLLNPFFLRDKVVAARFEREAKISAGLSHSNIIQIFDTGKTGDFHYIVMEYLEESLRERMKLDPQGLIPIDAGLKIIEKIFRALDYAHLRGVCHRDIKPENIMFRQDNTPVLVDFGIARVYDSSIQLTGSDSIIGTIHYMSPEQGNSSDIDGRSDIYSLGVVLYEMLTGDKPYKGDNWISVLHKHIEDPVPILPEHLSRYQPLIDSMMAKNREQRLSTGAQFARLLDTNKSLHI